jgi:hypothetical protein
MKYGKTALFVVFASAAIAAWQAERYYGSDRAYAQSGPSIPPPVCNQLDRCPLFVGLQKQVQELEKTVAGLTAKYEALKKRVDNINSAPARFKLMNEKTSQCLKWIDNNQPPYMLSCDHDYQIWTMSPQ